MKFNCDNPHLLKKIFPYAVVLCILAATLPYFYSLGGEFVFDDLPLIRNDPFYVKESNPLKCWNRDFWMENKKQGLYRPVTIFSFWLNARIKDGDGRLVSQVFRTTNLVLHILVTLLVLKLALRLRFGHWPAIFAAAIFAVHPIHTEAVIPAYGRAELLCALFVLLALILHTYADRNRLAIPFAGLSLLFACWSKEHGVAVLPLCVLLDLYLKMPIKRFGGLKPLLKEKAPAYMAYLGVLALFFISRRIVTGTFFPSNDFFDPAIDNPIALCHFPLNLISAIKIQGFALSKFFWPAVLSHDYSYAQLLPSVSVFDWKAWLTLLLFFGIPVFLGFAFRKIRHKIAFLVVTYVLCILPSGNFIIMTGTIFGERLQYIPSIMLCFFMGLILKELFTRLSFRTALVVAFAIVFLLSLRTRARGEDWDTQMSLAVAGVRTAPMSIKTWNNLTVELGDAASLEKDPVERANKYREAVLSCDMAISIYPRYVTAYVNRGLYNSYLGRYQQAEQDLRKAISMHTNHFIANYTLGALLANQGRLEEARDIWGRLIRNNPSDKLLNESYSKLLKEIDKKNAGKMKSD